MGMHHVYTITYTFLDLIQRDRILLDSLNASVILDTIAINGCGKSSMNLSTNSNLSCADVYFRFKLCLNIFVAHEYKLGVLVNNDFLRTFWMIQNPLRFIGSMIQNDVTNTKHFPIFLHLDH